MKKTALYIVILLFCGHSVFAQIGLNTDNSPPDPSSALDLKFIDKGVLIPRITSAAREAMDSPAPGLLVYQTDETEGFWFYNGSAWSQVISTKGYFAQDYLPKYTEKDTLAKSILFENNNGIGAGTTSTRNKHLSFPVGSGISWGNQYSRIYDNLHLHFITDDSLFFDDNYNGTRMFINTNTGRVGIGTTNPDRTLDVNGVTRSRTATGSANSAGQFQSIVAGTAQGQHAVYSFYPTFENTGDNGPRRAADILAGYNGGGWSKEYLSFNVGNNGSANDAQDLTSEKMRITGNGNIGIGTTSPNASALLDVTSTSRGFLMPRMTKEKIMEIASPANGLMVFCTTNNKFYRYNSSTSTWREVSGGTSILIPGTCGGTFTVSHVAGNVAPVDKTVTYGTVTNVPGEPEKCWITRNLGASQQATAVNDASEASAGWYWQFNRSQGYKHDGTTRTPNTTWISNIDENSDWNAANDPCDLLLGSGWRIPTSTEWFHVSFNYWSDWNAVFNSSLKIHAAGYLNPNTGQLEERGTEGDYWSSIQYSSDPAYASNLFLTNLSVGTVYSEKEYGYSLRCIRCVNPSSPVEGTHIPSENQVIWNWTAVDGANGYKWNTTNDYSSAEEMGSTTTKTETSLAGGTVYVRYAWAYNACGYSVPVSLTQSTLDWIFSACGDSMTVQHPAGNVAPLTKTVTYGTVTNIPGETSKCWITSNLGSTRQATGTDDNSEASAGWYWQFNRMQGYMHDGTTLTPAWTITNINEDFDWLFSNDPCAIELGSGWHIPTSTEWTNVYNAGNWIEYNGHWDSPLKTHSAGAIYDLNGSLYSRGSEGFYWSSSQMTDGDGHYLYVNSGWCASNSYAPKAYGLSVRCIKCSDPGSPTEGTHVPSVNQIIWNWNTVTGASGYKWNTTNDYNSAVDMGTATTKTETGLTYGTAYPRYAWAYNSCGNSVPITLNSTTLSFTCGSTSLTIDHVAGNVAPVNKTVTYGTVTSIPGETSKCWITSNLGTDQQATAVDDATEASAGWYWRFNRMQGYKHDGTDRIPNSTWTYPISEDLHWAPANDPCALEFGNGWRIPTNTEWSNVKVSGGWTDWNGAWNSALKLHAAGNIHAGGGYLQERGIIGIYWSSNQFTNNTSWCLTFISSWLGVNTNDKGYGATIRCIRE